MAVCVDARPCHQRSKIILAIRTTSRDGIQFRSRVSPICYCTQAVANLIRDLISVAPVSTMGTLHLLRMPTQMTCEEGFQNLVIMFTTRRKAHFLCLKKATSIGLVPDNGRCFKLPMHAALAGSWANFVAIQIEGKTMTRRLGGEDDPVGSINHVWKIGQRPWPCYVSTRP